MYRNVTYTNRFDFVIAVEVGEAVSFAPKLVPRFVCPPSTRRTVLTIVGAYRNRNTLTLNHGYQAENLNTGKYTVFSLQITITESLSTYN